MNQTGVLSATGTVLGTMGQFAGVGFAIPTAMIKVMLPKLIKGEKIVRGQLGVLIQDMTKGLAKQFGLSEAKGILVSQVNKGSPAEKAGIKSGDVIVRYAGKDVATVRQLRNMVASTAPSTKVPVAVFRNGKEETLTVTVGTQSGDNNRAAPAQSSEAPPSKLGLSLQALTPKIAKELALAVDQGTLVVDVADGSPAATAGIQKGDVIVEADRKPVANLSALEQVLAKTTNSGQVLLRIVRQGGSLFVVINF